MPRHGTRIGPFTWVSRREPLNAGSPQYTPYEDNSDQLVLQEGNIFVSEKVRDSLFNSRPSRHRTVFFLQPDGTYGDGTGWMFGGFDYTIGRAEAIERDQLIAGKETLHLSQQRQEGIVRGGWLPDPYRRNIAVPPTESYGDYVGESDGVAPYGLE
jgi:hypothetical protein